MRSSEIEKWASDVLQLVSKGMPLEDSRVELKRDWPANASRAARRLAGHANAARGEPILWLIGVDQKNGITGCNGLNLSEWFVKVKNCFDGEYPEMIDLTVITSSGNVSALYFETEHAPYVVRNPVYGTPDGGAVELEVPWREGTSVRSAKRSDLLLILVSNQKLSEVEVHHLDLELRDNPNEPETFRVCLYTHLYFLPHSTTPIVIPFRHCSVSVSIEPRCFLEGSPEVMFSMSGENIKSTQTEATIQGPGLVDMRTFLIGNGKISELGSTAHAKVRLHCSSIDLPIVIDLSFEKMDDGSFKPVRSFKK